MPNIIVRPCQSDKIIKFHLLLVGVARGDPEVVAEYARGQPAYGRPPCPAPRGDRARQAHRWQGNSLYSLQLTLQYNLYPVQIHLHAVTVLFLYNLLYQVYGGMLILENWKLSRFGQGFNNIKHVAVSVCQQERIIFSKRRANQRLF